MSSPSEGLQLTADGEQSKKPESPVQSNAAPVPEVSGKPMGYFGAAILSEVEGAIDETRRNFDPVFSFLERLSPGSSVRDDFEQEFRLFRAISMYRELKIEYLAHRRAVGEAVKNGERQSDVLSESELELVKAEMVHYADYLNSYGIAKIEPFDEHENLELFQVSSILRYAGPVKPSDMQEDTELFRATSILRYIEATRVQTSA